MPKLAKTPVSVLQSFMDEYQLNPFSLSKAINLSSSGTCQLVTGKIKISVPMALRLAKLFGQTPAFWLDLKREADISEASKDKDLQEILKGISKAKKPVASKPKASDKPDKAKAIPEKQKTDSKAPGVKRARGRHPQKRYKKADRLLFTLNFFTKT
jgi:addiction module HigA family antidote